MPIHRCGGAPPRRAAVASLWASLWFWAAVAAEPNACRPPYLRRADIPRTRRGDAAAATRIIRWRRVAATDVRSKTGARLRYESKNDALDMARWRVEASHNVSHARAKRAFGKRAPASDVDRRPRRGPRRGGVAAATSRDVDRRRRRGLDRRRTGRGGAAAATWMFSGDDASGTSSRSRTAPSASACRSP